MKFFLCFFSICALFWVIFSGSPVSAHIAGQPPFFTINGEYTDLYPVPGSSIASFVLPQDIAKRTYLVGQPLTFGIDFVALGVPKSVFQKSRFDWDFGDGIKTTGVSASHKYARTGSYVLTISVLSPDLPTPQLFQSVLLHVVNTPSYVLPVAKIRVNGQEVKSATDIVYADLSHPVHFESVSSADSYFWDFGDGSQPSNLRSVTHAYPVEKFPGGLTVVSAVLRIKNEDGFFADAYTMVYDNSLKPSPTPSFSAVGSANSASTHVNRGLLGFVVGCIVVLFVGILVVRKK